MTRKIVNARTGEVTFDDYEPYREPPSAGDIKREALRRINAIADGRTRDQLLQRALRLIMKVTIEGGALTAGEQAEIAAGKQQAERIETIQAAEKALLAMDPKPTDFASDRYWR